MYVHVRSQAYNTLLSVDKLLECCDALLLLRNEELHATCVVRRRNCQSLLHEQRPE